MYKDTLKIDPLSLDTEWLNQPGLFMFWAEKAVGAKEASDKLKFQCEVLEADLAKRVRKDPKAYGLEKAPEAAVKSEVLLSKKYQALYNKFLESRSKADELQKFVTALEQRRKALENLCFLQNQGYYSQPQSEPSINRKAGKARETRRKRGVKGGSSS